MNKKISKELEAEFVHDMRSVLLVKGPVLELKLNRIDAWMLLTGIQLALRSSSRYAIGAILLRSIAERLIALVATTPALREMAELGFNPDYDVPVEH